jgi:hypothetical protein
LSAAGKEFRSLPHDFKPTSRTTSEIAGGEIEIF